MRFGWRSSRVEPEKPEENHHGDPGLWADSYRSPGLCEALLAVPRDGSGKILDLGSTVGENVEFLTSIAEVLQIVDVFGTGAAEDDARISKVDEGMAELRSLDRKRRRSFDLVLTWDLFNYLPETRSTEVLRLLTLLCRPAALLHTIIHATETMPDLPNRYRILGNDRLLYESLTSDRRGGPHLLPASVERLLTGFQIEHSYVLRHGIHEYVARFNGLAQARRH